MSMNLGGLTKIFGSKHPEQTDQAFDAAGDTVNQDTDNRYSGEIDSAERHGEDYLGVQGDQQQQ